MDRDFLIRFFPEYRRVHAELEALREDHARLTQENLRLQDRIDTLAADRSRLWDTMQESLRNERTAYQMHINQTWQRMGGGVPYPEAPHLSPGTIPDPASAEPMGRRRILASEAVKQRQNEFIQEKFGKD